MTSSLIDCTFNTCLQTAAIASIEASSNGYNLVSSSQTSFSVVCGRIKVRDSGACNLLSISATSRSTGILRAYPVSIFTFIAHVSHNKVVVTCFFIRASARDNSCGSDRS